MNERIKELIKSLGIIPEDEHYEVAELIVQECINQVNKSNYNSGDEWDKAMTCASNNIKEHFGVQ